MNTILFDLDGTLLPLDQDDFIKQYFKLLAKEMSLHGYDPKQYIEAIYKGTYMMLENCGISTNEEVFLGYYRSIFKENADRDMKLLDAFYKEKFDDLRSFCGFNPDVPKLVDRLKSNGYKLCVATSPVFPRIAIEKRIEWAGLDINAFVFVSTYENSHFCKPKPEYYIEILEKLSVAADDCLMVGNDTLDDMSASKAGINTFLLTDHLVNRNGYDVSLYNHGDISSLYKFIDSLSEV